MIDSHQNLFCRGSAHTLQFLFCMTPYLFCHRSLRYRVVLLRIIYSIHPVMMHRLLMTTDIQFYNLKIQTMGTINGGVLGGFNGKVGAVIGSHWKGKPIMRGKSTAKRAKSSELQIEQQAKFSLMVNFLQPIIDFLNISYKKAAVQMSGFNKAISANIQ